jgi:hypothetical protein
VAQPRGSTSRRRRSRSSPRPTICTRAAAGSRPCGRRAGRGSA